MKKKMIKNFQINYDLGIYNSCFFKFVGSQIDLNT